ncbi:MAG: metallophosphoesterase family protein [Lachnospiraceae bacterium]|nr:metallophosphoesterase family protein [Lachnospiraceae bacterium]
MRILVIGDVESKSLWDYYDESKLKGIDLILSSGDLKPQYLSFLATFTTAPVLYVRGNHDDGYEQTPPDGCICIEDTVYEYKGIRILGLGGSKRYKLGINQYSEKDMYKRAVKMWLKTKYRKGFDILLTHAPAKGLGDTDDRAHSGFETFVELMDKYKPKYMVHGHVHREYSYKFNRTRHYKETTIINSYEKCIFEFETGEMIDTY